MPPAPLDLRRFAIVKLLHGSKTRVAPRQQIACVRHLHGGQPEQRSRIPGQRQPARRHLEPGEQRRRGCADRPHADFDPPLRSCVRQRLPGGHAARRDGAGPGQRQLVIGATQRESVPDDLAVPGGDESGGRRRPQADARWHHVGAVLAEPSRPAQPRLAVLRDDELCAVSCCRPGQFVVDAGPQRTVGFERCVVDVGGGRQVQRRHRPDIGQRSRDGHGRLPRGQPEVGLDHLGHHVDRYRGGLLEHSPLGTGLVGQVWVVGVQQFLLCTADDQHGCTQHQHRPQRFHLTRGQRPDGVESPHRRQDRGRFGTGVAKHRRHADRQFGHGPAVGQVAEVDDPIRARCATGRA